MAERRELTFARLDDVMPEVERLLAGHEAVGGWSLGQTCRHLVVSINLMLGAGRQAPLQPVPEAVRKRFFRRDRFPDGVESPLPSLLPPPGLDDRKEAEALGNAIGRFTASVGPFAAHPLLGEMTKDEWTRFHCMHVAHHLGFLVPV